MGFQTDRLIVRELIEEDYDLLRELDRDPEVLRYRSRKHITPEMTREFLDRAQRSVQEQPRLFYPYAIILRADNSWMGQCGLTVLTPEGNEAFVWYSLLPRYWGHGYAGEAVRTLLITAVLEFKMQRIIAECHPDNQASIHVMEKAGMQYEGFVEIPGPDGVNQPRIRYRFEAHDVF